MGLVCGMFATGCARYTKIGLAWTPPRPTTVLLWNWRFLAWNTCNDEAMAETLTAGTHIAHYRVVSHLGEGGMGAVYLADDTRLGRRVALKVLPANVAADPDRMHRFVQEAKLASALTHPNVAYIYELGEDRGELGQDRGEIGQGNGRRFLAMEYI